MQKLQLPIWLHNGIFESRCPAAGAAPVPATAQAGNLPAPAQCNGGNRLRLGGLTVDLTADSPLLSMPAGTKVLDGVALNKILAAAPERIPARL